LIAIDLDEGDELNWVKLSSGSDELIIATTDGKAVRFNEKQARPMGRDTHGVRAITLRKNALVAGFDIIRKDAHLLVVSARGYGKAHPAQRVSLAQPAVARASTPWRSPSEPGPWWGCAW